MNILGKLKEYMRNRTFLLDGFRVLDLLQPYYIDRKTIYEFLKQKGSEFSDSRGAILDFGCGSKPYEKLFQCKKYISCDICVSGHSNEDKKVDCYYDGHTLPFSDEEFDVIIATQVFEHIENLDEIMRELCRVLKKGGKMIITVPLCYEEHEKPYDFRRFTQFGLQKLLVDNSINVTEMRKSTSYADTVHFLASLRADNVYRKNKTWFNFIKRYVSCFIANLQFVFRNKYNRETGSDLTLNLFAIGKKPYN